MPQEGKILTRVEREGLRCPLLKSRGVDSEGVRTLFVHEKSLAWESGQEISRYDESGCRVGNCTNIDRPRQGRWYQCGVRGKLRDLYHHLRIDCS